MDITPVFGTVVPGSNPGGSTKLRARRAILCSRSKWLRPLASGFERKTGLRNYFQKIGLSIFW